MAPRSRKQPDTRSRFRSSSSSWRTALAIFVLLAGVATVVGVVWRQRQLPALLPAVEQPLRIVREVAVRHGCSPDSVVAEEQEQPDGDVVVVTVHVPQRFPVQRFSLDLQAAVHNLGGHLEPRPLTEGGGYGLARLEGKVGEVRWRVVVLGEKPPPPERRSRPPAPQGGKREPGGQLAVVLDDAGHSLEVCEQVRPLPPTVAVAVLPNTPHASAVAACLAAQGREVLVHLPMQAVDELEEGVGPDAIEVGLSGVEVGARLQRALARVPGARGVNNHMGSLATTDVSTMEVLARALRPTGLYFLDSRTTPETVAEAVMREAGVPVLRRDVFLDVVDEPTAVRRALAQAVELARERKRAVAIGHVHIRTLQVLASELPQLRSRVTLVRPSALASRTTPQ